MVTDPSQARSRARPASGSRELGLVLARLLLGVDDLHYGLWTPGMEVRLGNLGQAQQNYSDLLLGVIAGPPRPGRVLDVGCGTGRLLVQLLDQGYEAVGLSPSVSLNDVARQRLQQHGRQDTQVLTLRFEDVDPRALGRFDVVLFSESFQYIDLRQAFLNTAQVLSPGGRMVVCDFFRTDASGDGGPGDGAFGGGHRWRDFGPVARASGFEIVRDEDITPAIAPSLQLVDELLQQRIGPAALAVAAYARERHPLWSRLVGWLWRRRLARLRFKYLSGHRSAAAFSRYKTYRLLVLRRQQDP